MRFDTCNEYTFNNARMYWHSLSDGTLVISEYVDGKHNRIMVNNVSKEEGLRFAKYVLEESCKLDEETADVSD